jgi:hypothetical protein
MNAEISFDTSVSEDGQRHIEGCYRMAGRDWQIFYFTSWWQGRPWQGAPRIIQNQVWQSGITGVEVRCQDDLIVNKTFVKNVLSDALGVTEWLEVVGPDSLQLK